MRMSDQSRLRLRECSEMCFFFSLVPATFWLVVGYLVLYMSARLDGPAKTFGRVLATWTFVISGLIVLAGAYVTAKGLCPISAWMSFPA